MTDLTDLSAPAYRVFDVLRRQPRSRISKVGVTDLFVERLALECGRMTCDELAAALAEVEAAGLVLSDPDTHEVAVASHNVEDSNGGHAKHVQRAAVEFAEIRSERLRVFLWPHLRERVRAAIEASGWHPECHPSATPIGTLDATDVAPKSEESAEPSIAPSAPAPAAPPAPAPAPDPGMAPPDVTAERDGVAEAALGLLAEIKIEETKRAKAAGGITPIAVHGNYKAGIIRDHRAEWWTPVRTLVDCYPHRGPAQIAALYLANSPPIDGEFVADGRVFVLDVVTDGAFAPPTDTESECST